MELPSKAGDRSRQHPADARADAALARTLGAELTRAATRPQPAPDALTPSPPPPPAPRPPAPRPSALRPSTLPASTLRPSTSRAPAQRPPVPLLGSLTILALLNVVLFGTIVTLWGLPRWGASPPLATLAPSRSEVPPATSPTAAAPRDAAPADAAASRAARPRTPAPSGTAPFARSGAAASATAPPAASPSGRSPASAAASAAAGRSGLARSSSERPSSARSSRGQPASGARATREADKPPPRLLLPAVTLELPDAPHAPGGERPPQAPAPAPAVSVAGQDGVTMPERVAESYVQPTIAALPGGEPATGEVRLSGVVRTDGSVQDLTVIGSTRAGAGLEDAALGAVRRWRYRPATRDGVPVDARITIIVTFR